MQLDLFPDLPVHHRPHKIAGRAANAERPRRSRRQRFEFACLDCGVDTAAIDEYYMVTDEVWASANPADDPDEPGAGMLCIGSLERRLGRKLTPSDFTDCPVNTDLAKPRSKRLLDRLGRTA